MATNFPSSLDNSTTIPVEGSTTNLATNHITAHQNLQDAVEAIEAKIGADSSAVTTSHDYKLGEVVSTDKAVGKTATQTLTNKTLTAPTVTGATITTSTVNGVTLTTGGSATDFLAGNGTYVAGSVSNASTTAKGIVEAATSAEVTAGTATGATGAVLAVTPDALASSTPVFNGSGLTSIPRWLASGTPGTTVSNTTSTVLTYALAGGTLGTNKGVRIRFYVSIVNTASNASAGISVTYGGTTISNIGGYVAQSGTPTFTSLNVIDILLYGSGATGTQVSFSSVIEKGSTAPVYGPNTSSTTSSVDSTTSQNIVISLNTNSTGSIATFTGYFIEKIV